MKKSLESILIKTKASRNPRGGFMKRYALVNLGNRKIEDYPVSDEEMMEFLGGKGLAAKILMKELPAHADPLGEDNILIFNTGVLTGTGTPTSGRFNATSKSPLTGGIGHCNCGGDFGTFLKKAGFDGIIIKGVSDSPVYIQIEDGKIEILDASQLWGLDTEKTQEALGEGGGKLVIGPAGENLVRFACIVSGHRVLGRVGLGAVMGSKYLKAVVARGNKKIPVGDQEKFREIIRVWTKILRENAITGYQLPSFGTAGLVNMTNATHTLPTKNFSRGSDPRAYELSGEFMAENMLVKNIGCRFCPIRCGRWIELDGKQTKGPEYETIALMGANLENFDLRKVARLSNLCDRLGMDTISAGGVIGYAMEATEKGLIKSDMKFGNVENLERVLEDIAYRRGLGDDMAEGSMRLAEKYGGREFAIHSKGLELPGYEPRRSVGQGLGYATANRGGCHLNSGYVVFFEATGTMQIDPLSKRGKAQLNVLQQNLFDAISSCGSCLFTAYAVLPTGIEEKVPPYSRYSALMAKAIESSGLLLSMQSKLPLGMLKFNIPFVPYPIAISAVTGVDYTLGDFLLAGERVFNLERMFNLREGFSRIDDTLAGRILEEPQNPEDSNTKVPLAKMLDSYYKTRGWDEDGVPQEEILKKLKLDWLIPLRKEIKERIKTASQNRLQIRKRHDETVKKILSLRRGGK